MSRAWSGEENEFLQLVFNVIMTSYDFAEVIFGGKNCGQRSEFLYASLIK
jgi:hypothetical protein